MALRQDIDWRLIEAAARSLGIKLSARKKWKPARHVPYKWRYPIVKHLRGVIQMKDFEADNT